MDEAKDIAFAALETTKHYMPKSRNISWSSQCDLTNFFLIRNYHQTHIWQLEQAYNITGDAFFLELADHFESDFPSYQRNGSLYLSAVEHQMFKMDNIAVPTKAVETKAVLPDKAKAFNFGVRTTVEELEGIWLRITDQEHENWWVREEPRKCFPRVRFDDHIYRRNRRIVLLPGQHEHNQFNQWGSVINVEKVDLEEAKYVDVACKSLWNGVWYYQVSERSPAEVIKPGNWLRVENQPTISVC